MCVGMCDQVHNLETVLHPLRVCCWHMTANSVTTDVVFFVVLSVSGLFHFLCVYVILIKFKAAEWPTFLTAHLV